MGAAVARGNRHVLAVVVVFFTLPSCGAAPEANGEAGPRRELGVQRSREPTALAAIDVLETPSASTWSSGWEPPTADGADAELIIPVPPTTVEPEKIGMFAYHKALFPMDFMDVVAFCFTSAGLIVAAGGGVGGGGIVVPVFMLFLKFRPKHAIALSNFTILGGSIVTTWSYTKRRRSDGRPLIDWNIIVMMEPSTIAGALVGSFMAKYLSDFVLMVCLTLVLGMLSYRTAQKGVAMYRRECRDAAEAAECLDQEAAPDVFEETDDEDEFEGTAAEGGAVAAEEDEDDDYIKAEVNSGVKSASDQVESGGSSSSAAAAVGGSIVVADPDGVELSDSGDEAMGGTQSKPFVVDISSDAEENDQLLIGGEPPRRAAVPPGGVATESWRSAPGRSGRPGSSTTPWRKISALAVCFLGCVVLTILKGSGDGSVIGVACGTPPFWLLSVSILPWVLVFGLYFRRQLIRETMGQAGHKVSTSDIVWDSRTTVTYPMLCSFAGVFSGVFGVGGGIVKGPLMLEMGVPPDVTAATAATMILFTTAAACVSFQVFGLLEPSYGFAGFVMGLACTAVSHAKVNDWMKAARRHSPQVLSIAGIMAFSTGLLGLQALVSLFTMDLGELFRPASICSDVE